MRVDMVDSLVKFLGFIEQNLAEKKPPLSSHGEPLYRGQSGDYPLLPKIARENLQAEVNAREAYMLAELRRRGALYKSVGNLDEWDLLTFAQHNGMATRLLDWSSNPLTAIWFACKDDNSQKDAFVYLLSPSETIRPLDRQFSPTPDRHVGVSVLRPNLSDPRVVAQDGWFTVHSESRKHRKFLPLEASERYSTAITKISIKGAQKNKILQSLDVLGVCEQTIFPDIQGVCGYLNWKSKDVVKNS
jgi:FRG domain